MSTIDTARVARNCAEYIRRKNGGFDVPEEKPESEKTDFYKMGERIAEKVLREVFDEIERDDRENTALSKLAGRFHQK